MCTEQTLGNAKIGILSGILPGISTHFTFDNNDLRQETINGHNTSHHTNFFIFQPSPPQHNNDESLILRTSQLNVSTSDPLKAPEFRLNKKSYTGPKLFTSYTKILNRRI